MLILSPSPSRAIFREADYLLDFGSRGTIDVRNVGRGRNWADGEIKGTSPKSCWTDGPNRNAYTRAGSDNYIELPDSLMESRARGAVGMVVHITTGKQYQVTNANPTSSTSFDVSTTAGTGVVSFVVDGGSGATTLNSPNGSISGNRWSYIGLDWGKGMVIYVNQKAVASNTTAIGTGTAGSTTTIGARDLTGTPAYYAIKVAFFGVWGRALGAKTHNLMYRELMHGH